MFTTDSVSVDRLESLTVEAFLVGVSVCAKAIGSRETNRAAAITSSENAFKKSTPVRTVLPDFHNLNHSMGLARYAELGTEQIVPTA